MLELNESQCKEVTEKLVPINKEGVFDRYLNGMIASPVRIFGKVYYPSEILKTFDRSTYDKELDFYFEGCDLYTKVDDEYYRTFSIRKVLNIQTPLPTNFNLGFQYK